MNRPTNIALLALAAIAAVWAERAFISPGFVEVSPASTATNESASTSFEGRVLSVDPPAGDDAASSVARKARVKLRSGEIVRASVGGCVIFPGQTTRLAKYGSGSEAFYVVTENGKNDG